MIFEIDDIIPFSKRHKDETIREIIRYDSGYLKDLMIKDNRLVFSANCFNEIKRLTKNHSDNWKTPKKNNVSIFKKLKTYATPYLHSFNDSALENLNNERLLDGVDEL